MLPLTTRELRKVGGGREAECIRMVGGGSEAECMLEYMFTF